MDRYHDRHSRSGDRYSRESRDYRQHSSSRSSSHHRSRRSPSPGPSRSRGSPGPRDPETLPDSFGRVQDSGRPDDDLNILQRMKTAYKNSPLADLYECVRDGRKIKLWTRNYKKVRGVMTGSLIAFDKHWNLILKDVDEVFLMPRKSKTPFLRDVSENENLPDMPAKVPKVKKTEAEKAASSSEPKPPESSEEKSGKKKKKNKKKKGDIPEERKNINQIFVRGDNIVMICTVLDTDE